MLVRAQLAQVCRRSVPKFAAVPTTAARGLSSAANSELDKLVIFDTTLRDGEQSPGATLNTAEKLALAKQISKLGVDVCEAGFPIASPGDFEAVHLIATEVGPLVEGRASGEPMMICGLARAMEKDIERAYNAVSPAPLHRIHTFLATSDIHLEHKLKISRAECIEQVAEIVAFAVSTGADIEFSPEDAGRSDPAFLVDVLTVAIEAGATTLNIPDTTGYTLGSEYGELISYLRENTPGGKDVIFSTHCHNDLGLATANTIAGVVGGARQAEVTINGIGERAGNTSLEEIVMAVKTRQALFPVHVDHIDTVQITRSSQMVSHYTGMIVQRNKAIVGANAFAHEAVRGRALSLQPSSPLQQAPLAHRALAAGDNVAVVVAGNPPGWDAEEPDDLRDYDSGVSRVGHLFGARQALWPGGVQAAARGARL